MLASITKPKPLPRIILSLLFLGVVVLGSLPMMASVAGPDITVGALHVHLLSLAIGGVVAAAVFRWFQSAAEASQQVAFRPLESRFQKKSPA